MRLTQCYRTAHFRELARRRLPAPIFHYIGVDSVDLSVEVLGQRLAIPYFFSPTAMQRLFHHEGERAIAQAAEKFGTMFGVSTLGTSSIEDMAGCSSAPKIFQLYIHNDIELTSHLISRCKSAGFNALTLTVDTIVAGNRERDYITGMSTPPRLTLKSLVSFATHPQWSLNYLLRESFDLPNISGFIQSGTGVQSSIVDYLNTHLKRCINWDDAAAIVAEWGGPFAIKGVMSVDDARRCVEIGASAIIVSNHGGRQLDGSRAPIDQLGAILDAVGGEIEVILDGGIRRGTHVLKALAMGATACSGGRQYFYALAGGGYAGVERATALLRGEMQRDMYLMGCRSVRELKPSMLARRPR